MSFNLTSLPSRDLPLSDEDLWEAFRQGDRDAYRKLYSRYLDPLYNYGFKIIPEQAKVADHIQDLFIDLWKYKESLAQVKGVKPYLFRALRNRIIKETSQNRKLLHALEREYHYGLVVLPLEDKIIERQTQSDMEKKLQEAFPALSARQKEVINLLFYENFSYQEVADMMHINLRSVYTLAWKALSVLRKELGSLLAAALVYFFVK